MLAMDSSGLLSYLSTVKQHRKADVTATMRRVSNSPEVRSVVEDAVARGWQLVQKDRSHDVLRNGSHRVGISGTPKDRRSSNLLAADIKRCEKGDCLHGGKPAQVRDNVDPDAQRRARIAADREKNDRLARELEQRALTTTHSPIVRPTPPTEKKEDTPVIATPKKKATRNRSKPKVEKAVKWLTWYMEDRGSIEHPKLMAEGLKAGHADGTIRKAISELGLRIERRGPRKPALVHPPATSEAEPAPEPSAAAPAPAEPPKPAQKAHIVEGSVNIQLARVMGMAEMLHNDHEREQMTAALFELSRMVVLSND